ncbi:MAG: hypothetical protein IPH76_11200 [Xanthomonadales bacterium]|nr:hypothetical protein [Xanthomonadales bacterium]
MVRLLLGILFIAMASPVSATPSWPRDLARWVEIPVPKANKVDREVWESAANWSPLEWRVRARDGRPIAEPYDRTTTAPPQRPGFLRGLARFGRIDAFIQVKDGWLLGFDRGGEAPALYWFNHDGARSEKIGSQHIAGFFLRADGVHAIEGSNAAGAHHGAVIRIARTQPGGRWQTSLLTRLPNTPEAVSMTRDGTALITLADAVVAIDARGQLHGALAHAPWPKFYPNSSSLSADEQRLYIGMRQYVAEFDRATRRLRFLVPHRDALHRLSREEERGIRGYVMVKVTRRSLVLPRP